MPLWRWRGYDAAGYRTGYSLKADREDFIASWRGAEGEAGRLIVLTELNRVSEDSPSARRFKPSNAALVRLTRLLALMMEADIPVATAFEQLVEQSEGGKWRRLIGAITEELEAGAGLHDAFAHQQVFSPFYLAVLRAVEQGADRRHLLPLLAEVLERDGAFVRRMLGALLYPALLLLAGLGAVSLMVVWVIPSMRPLLGDGELPALTAGLLRISDVLVSWRPGWLELAAVAALAITGRLRQKQLAHLLAGLPLVRQASLARCASVMAALQAGRVPVVQALRIAAGSAGAALGAALLRAVEEVERGVTLSSALQMQRQVPPLWCRLMRAGEVSGDYGRTFSMLEKLHSRQLERQQALMERLAEPLLIAAIGSMLTLVLLGLYLPILRAGTAF